MFGSSPTVINCKIMRFIGIRLLSMSISIFDLCVCHEIKRFCVYPLFLFASAECTGFHGFYVFVVVSSAGCVFYLLYSCLARRIKGSRGFHVIVVLLRWVNRLFVFIAFMLLSKFLHCEGPTVVRYVFCIVHYMSLVLCLDRKEIRAIDQGYKCNRVLLVEQL